MCAFIVLIFLSLSPPSSLPPSLRQVQDLESKFKDAYSQSLSTKDERIQVLEKRVEETLQDNTQLRADLATLRKQHETLKGRRSSSPNVSPALAGGRAESAAAADAGKMKEKVEVLHQTVRKADIYPSG